MAEDLGPEPGLTRPYVLTGGRTLGASELPLEAIVVTQPRALPLGASPEVVAIAGLCRTPYSIVEVAARLRLPLGVVRVLVGDLVEDRVLAVGVTAGAEPNERVQLLERLLDGVKSL